MHGPAGGLPRVVGRAGPERLRVLRDPRIAANYGTYLTDASQAGLGAFVRGMNLGALSPIPRLTIPILPLWLWYPLALLLLGLIAWGAVRVFPRAPALGA